MVSVHRSISSCTGAAASSTALNRRNEPASVDAEVLVEQVQESGAGGVQDRTPYFEFRHISKSFGSNQVLDDVSFRVMAGETVSILGKSGVGKSVCLRIFMGFLKPDAGRVIAAGEDITDYPEEELQRIRKKVTMVFQDGALFDSLTVAENVAFPLRGRGELDEDQIEQIVDGLLDLVGVRAKRDLLPSEIPTGLKRSVAIARALASQPESILYDEPTTMVDPLMARLLSNLIRKLKLDLRLTGVVVTHDMRLVERLADHVVFLDRCKVIFYGTTEEMQHCPEAVVQDFLKLDRLNLQAILSMTERKRRLAG